MKNSGTDASALKANIETARELIYESRQFVAKSRDLIATGRKLRQEAEQALVGQRGSIPGTRRRRA